MNDPVLVNPVEEDAKSKSRVRLAMSAIYILLMATAVMLAILRGGAGNPADETIEWFVQWWWIPLLVALVLGSSAIFIDALTPRKKLSGITGIFFGLIAGLLATVALSFVIDLIVQTSDALQNAAVGRIIMAVKAAFALTLCYLGASIVYATQDEFRLVIPYVEFSKQFRGTRPLVLDTSAIIDGRFNDIALTGFIAAPVIIPRFVINELQTLSDSSDRLKRSRGRRGLDMVRKLQNNPHIDLGIADENPPGAGVDQKLLIYAQQHKAHLVTTDFNLNKVASIHEVNVLNVNDLANALKPAAVPGEELRIEIIKRGEGEGQGVGYLDDGTMVVVENAADSIGRLVQCTVTSSIQTSAGRMIFCDMSEWGGGGRRADPGTSHQGSTRHASDLKIDRAVMAEQIESQAPADRNASNDDETTGEANQDRVSSKESGKASQESSPDDDTIPPDSSFSDQVSSSSASAMHEKSLHAQKRVQSTQRHPKPRTMRSKRNPRRGK